MTRDFLVSQIRKKQNFLCIGLDPDIEKLPSHLSKDAQGVKEFCLNLIEATKDFCVSYKPNLAFFEPLGWQGMKVLEEVIEAIPKTHFIIADAKRGDIGNTSTQYAKAFFETMSCDAVTIAPYMGSDSIKPFLAYPDKWAIVLGLTSNAGAEDFELQKIEDQYLYECVLEKVSNWGSEENVMFVIGATQSAHFAKIRSLVPNHFLLIPGVGAQGGSLEDVCKGLINSDIGVLVNSSREIIYASSGTDYAEKAREKAKEMNQEMKKYF